MTKKGWRRGEGERRRERNRNIYYALIFNTLCIKHIKLSFPPFQVSYPYSVWSKLGFKFQKTKERKRERSKSSSLSSVIKCGKGRFSAPGQRRALHNRIQSLSPLSHWFESKPGHYWQRPLPLGAVWWPMWNDLMVSVLSRVDSCPRHLVSSKWESEELMEAEPEPRTLGAGALGVRVEGTRSDVWSSPDVPHHFPGHQPLSFYHHLRWGQRTFKIMAGNLAQICLHFSRHERFRVMNATSMNSQFITL